MIPTMTISLPLLIRFLLYPLYANLGMFFFNSKIFINANLIFVEGAIDLIFRIIFFGWPCRWNVNWMILLL